MLINLYSGARAADDDGHRALLRAEYGQAELTASSWSLMPPAERNIRYRRGKKAVYSYKDGLSVLNGDAEWQRPGHFFKAAHEAFLYLSYQDQHNCERIGRFDWQGQQLAEFDSAGFQSYFGEQVVVLDQYSESRSWGVFDLQGQEWLRVPQRLGDCFTDSYLFFGPGNGADYEVYAVASRQRLGSLRVAGRLLTALQGRGGRLLVMDAEGIHQLDGLQLRLLHRFSQEVDLQDAEARAWQDENRLYLTFNHLGKNDSWLYGVPQQGGAPVEELHWNSGWRFSHAPYQVDYHVGSRNYLPLQRQGLLADDAALCWTPDEPLTPALFDADLSPQREVSQTPSATKGKHGYRLRIRDSSVNRAVRTAAFELGRLLGECCSGAFNSDWPQISDRKFDGHFAIDICCDETPSDFERDYLPGMLRYFREDGGLSPAGSRASLQPLELRWLPAGADN